MTNPQLQAKITSLADQSAMLSRICKAKSAMEVAEITQQEADRITKESQELLRIMDLNTEQTPAQP